MAKKIIKILCFLTVFVILTSAVQIPVFALTDNITSVSDNSVRGSNDRVSALQADQEVKFNGTAIEYLSSTGTCSWNVRVDTIISGPSELQGHTVTVALWTGGSDEFPSGSMDPEIGPGDKVGVYGLYVDDDYVTLSGSEDYYISKTSVSNQPSVTVLYPNGGESISIGTPVQVSAHAADDVAVTGVTFYYSRDGGSNWDILGEGARISGTATDGMWNSTWNTDGLSAGTNYMIKAVANDGASTGEDRSDGVFSVTHSKLIRVPLDYPTIQAAIDAASSGYKITVSSGTYFEHLIIDKPLKLIGKDKNTTIINGSGSGYCVHVTADNVEIGGFTIENGGCGAYLESSNGSIMDNNIISDHGIGISLNDSNNNLIAHNGLSNNVLHFCAIHLSLSNNNVISENDIFENGAGVFLYDSNYNLIYHNNFINNQKQAYDSTGTNSWDKGSSVGGNYWSDHTCTGNPSDGSKPYSIASNSIDHYPFQKQSGWVEDNQPVIPDSAGAISVTSSPSGATIELECFVGPTITTPYTVTDVPVGTHTLKLTLDGYLDWSTNVEVIAGETTYLDATLTPLSTQTEMKPDLVISSIIGIGVVGEPLTIYYTITNRGNAVAEQSYTGLYIDGKYIKKDYVNSLAPGATINQKSFDYIWDCTAGDQAAIQVCADIGHQVDESNEMNNCKSEVWTCHAHPPEMPDLVITKVWHERDPKTLKVIIHYEIANQDKGSAGASTTYLSWYSTGNIISTDEVPYLSHGQTRTESFAPYAFSPSGFDINVCADGDHKIAETDETNNCKRYTMLG